MISTEMISDAASNAQKRSFRFLYVAFTVIGSPNRMCRTKLRDAPPITARMATICAKKMNRVPVQPNKIKARLSNGSAEPVEGNSIRERNVHPTETAVPTVTGGAAIKMNVQKFFR